MSPKIGRGFTLIELLVVVTIIAIISGSVVALLGGLTSQTATAMTFATEKQLTNEFNVYQKTHYGALPDSYDSLIRKDFPTTDTFTADPGSGALYLGSTTTPSKVIAPYIYTGYDTNADGVTPDASAGSKGLTVTLMGTGVQSLTVAKLRQSDVNALNSLGITTVYDIDPTQDAVDPSKLTRFLRPLRAGDPVMALVPTGLNYSAMNGFGNADAAGNPISKDLLLVFGIGPKCTIVGSRTGGVQEPPICPTICTSTTDKPKPRNDYYNYYMTVVKIPYDSYDKPAFVGILDSQGWNVQAGLQWYGRYPE